MRKLNGKVILIASASNGPEPAKNIKPGFLPEFGHQLWKPGTDSTGIILSPIWDIPAEILCKSDSEQKQHFVQFYGHCGAKDVENLRQ